MLNLVVFRSLLQSQRLHMREASVLSRRKTHTVVLAAVLAKLARDEMEHGAFPI